jgi:isochorismate synthase/2-succinyl-5-enolpyruvyl-6-hydroxy-3-cyclohexene-1-carboxylate synthase/2-succinyl-6-hydroxy-2,4-cyclohexadiene-1-carboxylate synthase/O-succinylbenzoate synthase
MQPVIDSADPGCRSSYLPAVCGRPREAAFQWLSQQESFDRGYYAGPFGWISGAGAEWAVAIRSALIEPGQPGQTISNGNGTTSHDAGAALVNGRGPRQQQQQAVLPPQYAVNVYAGVGIVPGSVAASEWDELELKTRPIRSLLQPFPALMSAPNINIAWAGLLVEELCRQGVNMFCVAPGGCRTAVHSQVGG